MIGEGEMILLQIYDKRGKGKNTPSMPGVVN